MLYSDMTLYALLTGVIVPILVGILTKLDASSGLKAIFNFGLTALGTGLVTYNQTNWSWKAFAINFGFGWVVSVATYYGFYKPTTIAPKVASATSSFGIS